MTAPNTQKRHEETHDHAQSHLPDQARPSWRRFWSRRRRRLGQRTHPAGLRRGLRELPSGDLQAVERVHARPILRHERPHPRGLLQLGGRLPDGRRPGRQGQSSNSLLCLACHAPNAARDKTTKLDAKPAYAEGVNCVACHTLASYKGINDEGGKLRLGIKAYELSDKIQAPTGLNQGLQKLTKGDDPFGGAGASGEPEAQSALWRARGVRGQEDSRLAHGGQPQADAHQRCLHGLS